MKNYKKTRKILSIVGFISTAIGLTLTIVGFVSFFSSFGSFGKEPKLFWCSFLGLPLLGLGLSFVLMSFRSNITRYVINEQKPILSEALSTAAEAMEKTKRGIECSCGQICSLNDKFCSSCGVQLFQMCKNCGAQASMDDKYCSSCGEKL